MTGHLVGMKCPALRESLMHVKLNLSTYLDVLQRLPLVASLNDITSLERGISPTFVHVCPGQSTNWKYTSFSEQ